jgi:putative ABC transport system substrate-binding protein
MVILSNRTSYGTDQTDRYRPHAAGNVDRIPRREKPAGLPVPAPTKYELAINFKTAKSIGLTIPESFFLCADEMIK